MTTFGELPEDAIDEASVRSDASTQVAQPKRASFRTAVIAVLTLLPLINAAGLLLQGMLLDAGVTDESLPAWVWATLNGTVLVTGFVANYVNRLILIPGVNEWISEHLPFLAPEK